MAGCSWAGSKDFCQHAGHWLPALGDHLARSGKGLSPGKSASALLLDIRDSTGTSPLGEAEDTGLYYVGKLVYVLVMAAGPPSAHVHARAR